MADEEADIPNDAPAIDPTAALTQVLQGILTYLNNNGMAAAPRAPGPTSVVYDLYGHTNPHNLATKVGLTAYQESCQPLSLKWDGTVEKFPPFLIELRQRFDEYNWNATGDSGISTVDGKELLKEYHSITIAMVTAAFNNRTNDRAIQNVRALYKLLINSITGNVKKTLFESDNSVTRPRKNDGIDLLIKMILTTTLASIQTSIKATNKLTTYCPTKAKFNIVQVNADINHFIILATTATRTFEAIEQLSITITIYDKIKQPQEWVAWLQQKKIEFNRGLLTSCAEFQAEAVSTFNQITDDTKDGKFKGSLQTIQEEVVAMLIEKAKPSGTKRSVRGTPKAVESETDDKQAKTTRPPFLRWKTTKLKDGEPHKVGDTRDHEGKTYHYCDCPWHKGGIRWHSFSTADCRTRKAWLEKTGGPNDTPHTDKESEANLAVDSESPPDNTHKLKHINTLLGDLMTSLEESGTSASVPQALLADALTAVSELS